jgi:hypothetical protein
LLLERTSDDAPENILCGQHTSTLDDGTYRSAVDMLQQFATRATASDARAGVSDHEIARWPQEFIENGQNSYATAVFIRSE